jgi:hypothetical protein
MVSLVAVIGLLAVAAIALSLLGRRGARSHKDRQASYGSLPPHFRGEARTDASTAPFPRSLIEA